LNNVNIDPKVMHRVEAIILSMTIDERKNPDIIKASRKIRIANGCGQKVEDVNRLLKQYEQMKVMMKQMNSGKLKF
jgi:signal recognition particle subunit SRP54